MESGSFKDRRIFYYSSCSYWLAQGPYPDRPFPHIRTLFLWSAFSTLWSIRVSDIIDSDILDLDHLPITFHILDHVKSRHISDPVEEFTNWERFQSLVSDSVSPRIEIKSEKEAYNPALDFTTSVAPACRLSTSKVILSDLNSDLPGLYRLLKHKRKLRKLWHDSRDPACKTAVNWVAKSIRWMARRRALELWETKRGNSEATWPIAKSIIKKHGPRAPTVIHGPLGLKSHPLEKANAIADCLKSQFTLHDLCDGWRLEFKLCTKL
jgi:hypothetical protein